jgi:hypothetical protein
VKQALMKRCLDVMALAVDTGPEQVASA